MDPITLTFSFEKETKGAVRYQEQKENELAEPVVGTLYVRKSALAARGLTAIPRTMSVTVEAK